MLFNRSALITLIATTLTCYGTIAMAAIMSPTAALTSSNIEMIEVDCIDQKDSKSEKRSTSPSSTNKPRSTFDQIKEYIDARNPEDLYTTLLINIISDDRVLTAEQLTSLFILLNDPAKRSFLGYEAINEAFDIADKHNWALAKIIFYTATHYFKLMPTASAVKYRIYPIDFKTNEPNELSVSINRTNAHLAISFSPENVRWALFEAIEKDLWEIITALFNIDFVMEQIDTDTVNDLAYITGVVYGQYQLFNKIITSPITGPKLSYETCKTIANTLDLKASGELQKSHYVTKVMLQGPAKQAVDTTAKKVITVDDTPSDNDDYEIRVILQATATHVPQEQHPQQIAEKALQETHDCAQYQAWIKAHPTLAPAPKKPWWTCLCFCCE